MLCHFLVWSVVCCRDVLDRGGMGGKIGLGECVEIISLDLGFSASIIYSWNTPM